MQKVYREQKEEGLKSFLQKGNGTSNVSGTRTFQKVPLYWCNYGIVHHES